MNSTELEQGKFFRIFHITKDEGNQIVINAIEPVNFFRNMVVYTSLTIGHQW